MPAWLCRYAPAGSALAVFLAMSWLYWDGALEVYSDILRSWGIVPFQIPFLDIGFVLAAWDCTRRGWDVISYNPCDLLHLPFNYSPFWLTASGVPLGVRATAAVGLASLASPKFRNTRDTPTRAHGWLLAKFGYVLRRTVLIAPS